MKEYDQPDFANISSGIDQHFIHLPQKEAEVDEIESFEVKKISVSETPKIKKLDKINKARSIIRGERTLDREDLNDLISDLEKLEQFGYATEVLLVKMKLDESDGFTIRLKDYETLAKYIYKDHSLPSLFKFKKALQELTSHEDLVTTERCETLGLAGAIYKRKWQFDHQFRNLILARYYYKRGFEKWKEFIADYNNPRRNISKNDNGFNAINYAFINEQMAVDKLEEHGKITGFSESIEDRFKEAEDTRIFILQQFIDLPSQGSHQLKKGNYEPWVYATIAEAYFGLGNYSQATRFINEYMNSPSVNRWEVRSFGQQMFSLAYLQEYCRKFQSKYDSVNLPFADKLAKLAARFDPEGINSCLQLFDDTPDRNVESLSGSDANEPSGSDIKKEGKTGLALSGGGFRSALFHIGVLAALAEKNELKNIEVISCVSGGSIIGAYYYLKLKKLLELKPDDEITREDYITIVKEIEVDFLKGIQNNLRMRIFSNLTSNLKMFSKHYSRTHRLGELYEEYLFKPL
ncbi:MAG TPA: patatin-like phospholipase family protein, partial [Segetibacter sp.]